MDISFIRKMLHSHCKNNEQRQNQQNKMNNNNSFQRAINGKANEDVVGMFVGSDVSLNI